MSTMSVSADIPISKYAIVDIHGRALRILAPLKAYYVEGWKFSPRKGYSFRPDKRRKSTAHKARALLAQRMEIVECKDESNED